MSGRGGGGGGDGGRGGGDTGGRGGGGKFGGGGGGGSGGGGAGASGGGPGGCWGGPGPYRGRGARRRWWRAMAVVVEAMTVVVEAMTVGEDTKGFVWRGGGAYAEITSPLDHRRGSRGAVDFRENPTNLFCRAKPDCLTVRFPNPLFHDGEMMCTRLACIRPAKRRLR
ncbi:hypothetical protein KSP39_PZI003814 [Platanthera zijinensis]|uniref:Uncharacterized protein n=1 Tax=Platanthera zijinensis TaxID=2320716 RepID=A0AAP0BUG7_9ASPA